MNGLVNLATLSVGTVWRRSDGTISASSFTASMNPGLVNLAATQLLRSDVSSMLTPLIWPDVSSIQLPFISDVSSMPSPSGHRNFGPTISSLLPCASRFPFSAFRHFPRAEYFMYGILNSQTSSFTNILRERFNVVLAKFNRNFK